MSKVRMRGLERAAMLLLSVGEQNAAEVLRHVRPEYLRHISRKMTQMTNVDKHQLNQMLDEFLATINDQSSIGIDHADYVKSVIKPSLQESQLDQLMDHLSTGSNYKGLDNLKWMDPKSVAELICKEHPQIIATIISYLSPEQSAQVLADLPERQRIDVFLRVASLDGIQPAAIQELDNVLRRQFSRIRKVKARDEAGFNKVMNILDCMDSSDEIRLVELVRNQDPTLGRRLQKRFASISQLEELSNREWQTILKRVSLDLLYTALEGASETLFNRIDANLSKRSAAILQKKRSERHNISNAEKKSAQRELANIAMQVIGADSPDTHDIGST